jgi:peroxiredoxin Q/BCP
MGMKKALGGWLTLGLALGLTLAGCGSPKTEAPQNLQVGDRAADFSLQDSTGRFMKSSNVQPGWYLVLFFYRGSWCPACMNHLLDVKRDFPRFAGAHAALAAVSVDRVEDSAAFDAQWRFPFPLLSDTDFKLIDAYGLREAKGGHHGEDISHVAVVIIDPQKMVRYKYVGKDAFDNPSTDAILYIIQQLQAGKPIPQ